MRFPTAPLLILVSISTTILAQTTSPTNDKEGCSINNGSVIVPINTTVADDTWWYLCTGTSWLAQGCVVNGQRYNVGDTFYGYLNEFYGRCEALGGKYIRATILGCIDVNNKTVSPGKTYIADPLFWANCTSTKQQVQTPDLGNITLDIIGRKIIGCNDGSEDIIPDEGTFVQVSHDGPLLAGVGLVCKIQGSFPQVQPQVCVVANNSDSDETYIGLADHCYGQVKKFVFYCTIAGEEDLKNGTAIYGWEIGWNISTNGFLSFLKTNGFRDCINEPSQSQPSSPKHDNSTSAGRRRRDTPIDLDALEDDGLVSKTRQKRSVAFKASADLAAESKYIILREETYLEDF